MLRTETTDYFYKILTQVWENYKRHVR